MRFNEYVEKAMITKNTELTKEETLGNAAMGLSGETGEVVDIIKKHLYQGHKLNVEHIREEVGDILWYIALLADTVDLDVEEIMEENIEKLEKRYGGKFDKDRSINREV